jgi:pimeloyl-ACP methyl ester carboxylesterase
MDRNPASRCERIDVRGLQYNIRHWGPDGAPLLFMLHGWMDSSPNFQFVVDAFESAWHVVAPDWRGFGASEWLNRPYWFADYYGDLERILDHYSPDEPALLVGHSMGAAVASIYAGVRPARVARLAMLDFLGLQPTRPGDAPARIANWLDALKDAPRMRGYRDPAELARRLVLADPRLRPERASFLAKNGSRLRADGDVEMACDAWHKVISPYLYQVEEVMACWRAVEAPVLLMIADQGYVRDRFANAPDDYRRRVGCFRHLQIVQVTDAGHNVQHDQPEQVALALERFLLGD